VIVSAEHGGARVPSEVRARFESAAARRALASHRGWDPGSAELARALARALGVRALVATTSRLVCDANRSRGHRALFSRFTRDLPPAARARLLERWWAPQRDAVEAAVANGAAGGVPVVHLAVHSFTPVLDGERRPMDVAWLYDPSRSGERAFVAAWRSALHARRDDLVLARNRPYRGTADGLTTHLRRRFDDRVYAGIELEVNQRFPLGGDPRAWRRLVRDLVASCSAALER